MDSVKRPFADLGSPLQTITRNHSHFGTVDRTGFRSFRSIEYVPPKNRLWSRKDKGLFFYGHYVVEHYRLVAVRKWETKEQAIADRYFGQKVKS